MIFLIAVTDFGSIRWQRQENPKNDEDPHHHDVAILITRKDICSSVGCT